MSLHRFRAALVLPCLFLITACCAEFLCAQSLDGQSLGGLSPGAENKKNVLLICVDDLKPALGCYGDSVARTPNIDRLAKDGVVFRNAFCNQAVCSPSRNSLMTGLRPQTIGVYDLPTNFRNGAPDALTLGQFFHEDKGYLAEGLGKIYHTGHGNTDDQATWTKPHWRPKTETYRAAHSKQNVKTDSSGRRRYAATERADVVDSAYADGACALEAVRRIEGFAKNPQQPFFLAVGFIRPHLPFVAPEKYWSMYDPAILPMPKYEKAPSGAPSFAKTSWGELRNYSGIPEKGELNDELTRHFIHGYYAATSYMDAQVGLVMESLRSSGLAENTVVVLWGDHGWHLGDHGMWCKHTNYEQAARIPLIICDPAGPPESRGQLSDALIETVDIYPTIASLAGFEPPKGLDGKSQAAVVHDPKQSVRDHVIHVYPRGGKLGRAIRTARYRLVQWNNIGADEEDAIYELYDYEKDPLETQNYFDSQGNVAEKLIELLRSHPEPKPRVQNKQELQNRAGREKRSPEETAKLRSKWFAERDVDDDDRLTFEEFRKGVDQPDLAEQRFKRFDQDNDGVLSESEFVNVGQK